MKVRDVEPIIFRGGGDIATGSISYVYKAGYPVIILETDKPSAIRREVAFCEAVYDKEKKVEDVTCFYYDNFDAAYKASKQGKVALIVDKNADLLKTYKPHILVDAILAKKNLGTSKDMADFVIGLGPGFNAGVDVDYVIETMRGHSLGTIIESGEPIPNTNTPGIIAGVGKERVIHSPDSGKWHIIKDISSIVNKGDVIAQIIDPATDKKSDVYASISGVLRGTLREGFDAFKGLKCADIDPRLDEVKNCFLISDKAKTIAGSVLLLVSKYNY